ncbi:hypothetical protein [Pseudomonas mosselii]|nr:hypothetical protein [Pseudomonas mosselii]
MPGISRYSVVAAGISFFHITETNSGKVHGFRRRYQDAWELARYLER